MADGAELPKGKKIKIDYSRLKAAAQSMDDLRNNLDAQLAAWSKGITPSEQEGMTNIGGYYSGSGNDDLDTALYNFYNRFTSIASDAKHKLEKLAQTFRTVADQFLDNDLGLAASVNYQNYQYLLNAWAGKKSAYRHYLATKDVETTYTVYDKDGNPVTEHIKLWNPGDPTPTDPGDAPTSYTNTTDFRNPLFDMPDAKTMKDPYVYPGDVQSMTTHATLDHAVLDTDTGPNPPDSDKVQSPVLSTDTSVSYDGGTYKESTTFTVGHKYDYSTSITHTDGSTETSTCTADPDGKNATWTDVTKDTDGKTSTYKWTGDASDPKNRTLVDSPAMHEPKNTGGTGGHAGGGGRGLI